MWLCMDSDFFCSTQALAAGVLHFELKFANTAGLAVGWPLLVSSWSALSLSFLVFVDAAVAVNEVTMLLSLLSLLLKPQYDSC